MTVWTIHNSLKRWNLLNILMVLSFIYDVVLCVRIVDIDVPERVTVGETIHLGCSFDMEHENLYSLSWWKGSHQFYIFSPTGGNQPQQTIYDAPGIKVDRILSGLNKIVLRNVTRDTRGRFKCEVVAEVSYERDSKIDTLEVVEVPDRPPILTVFRRQFNAGEVLEANCSSLGINPPSKLIWFINSKRIDDPYTRMISRSDQPNNWFHKSYYDEPKMIHVGNEIVYVKRMKERPLPPIASNLKIVLRPNHFLNEGRITLTCMATIPDLYHKSTQVQLTLPGVAPVTSSHRISKGAKIKLPDYIFCIFLSIFLSFGNVDLFYSDFLLSQSREL